MRRAHDSAAEKRQRVHTIVNEPGAVAQVAAADPEALIIYRVHHGPGRDEPSPWDYQGRRWTGAQWLDHWWPSLWPGVRKDSGPYALTFLNEVWRPELAAFFADFYRQLIDACAARGVRCTYGNFSVGVFQPHPGTWPALRQLVDYGAGKGMVLAGNTYWFDEAPERFTYMLDIVRPGAPWCHMEVGWAANDAAYQPGRELELAARHDAAFVGRPGYLGGALWCLNTAGGGWEHSHFREWGLIARR